MTLRPHPTWPALLVLLLASACTTASPPPPGPADPVPAGPSEADRAAESFRAGMEAAEAGELDRALDLLEEAAAEAPDELRYGAEYRQAAIRAEAYDRSIDFFAALAAEHPDSPAIRLQWGYAIVDKIPAAGAVTGVILANDALDRFTEAIEREASWLALYTRGNSYVYWPPVFGRTKLGIADLERAVAMAEEGEVKSHHAYAYAALGDGWWRLEDLERAGEVWRRGLERVPGSAGLRQRLELLAQGSEALDEYLDAQYEIGTRVDTSLRELWDEE